MLIVNSNQAALFGGAKSINELYNDVLLYNIRQQTWTVLTCTGVIPSPRAAHSCCCIMKNNIIMFGGAKKNGGFTSNELYLLDLKNPQYAKWSILQTAQNDTKKPQQRYGHTLIYYKPFLILFGGVLKEKNQLSNELWITRVYYMNLYQNPTIIWEKITPRNIDDAQIPRPRLYHSAGFIRSGKAKGMIIIFGGRSNDQKALNDCWGLRKHRDNSWEWVKAPLKGHVEPLKRFQHTTLFYKNYMVVLGGRSENVEMCINGLPVEIYDSDKHEWYAMFSFDKFRHSSFVLDKYAFVHGGFYMSNFIEEPSDQVIMFDIARLCSEIVEHGSDGMMKGSGKNVNDKTKEENNYSSSSNSNIRFKTNISQACGVVRCCFDGIGFTNITLKPVIVNKAEMSFISVSDDGNSTNNDLAHSNTNTNVNNNTNNNNNNNNNSYCYSGDETNSFNNTNTDNTISHSNTNIKKGGTVINEVKPISFEEKTKFQIITKNDEEFFELYENFISNLLKPKEWKHMHKTDETTGIPKFKFRREHIIALTKACQEVVSSQPIVLRLNTPIKIFGDIHGQYDDLMRFFEFWGEPSEEPGVGDINSTDYLFLGDYVDRGVYSLETICLLMALKIKYPDKIHLLRGNHEDHLINSTFGFFEECECRLSDDAMCEELNVFKVINEFFEYLPLVAIVENEIVCVHGGIGSSFSQIEEVEKIQRPVPVVHEAITKQDQIIMDILWSDPTDNDEEKGIQPNVIRDSKSYGNIVKYGPDIVNSFLEKNNCHMIIRAHECVPDGFERFCEGNLITVFSATDYCKRHKNAGAMLLVTNNFEIVPYLIYPLQTNKVKWLEKEEFLKKRPPTPLRKRFRK